MLTHSLGFPRMGRNRELKKALEGYRKGAVSREELPAVGRALRLRHWSLQQKAGIDLVPVGDFSFYDHLLDMTAMLGAVPPRFGLQDGPVDLDTCFPMARGVSRGSEATAMEMTNWFDSNYHYLVPEFHPDQRFRLASERLFEEIAEARLAGCRVKLVLPGPLTYIALGKETEEGFDRWPHLDAMVAVYEQIVARLAGDAGFPEEHGGGGRGTQGFHGIAQTGGLGHPSRVEKKKAASGFGSGLLCRLKTGTSPVLAGSRVIFFAGPKESNQRKGLFWLPPGLGRGGHRTKLRLGKLTCRTSSSGPVDNRSAQPRGEAGCWPCSRSFPLFLVKTLTSKPEARFRCLGKKGFCLSPENQGSPFARKRNCCLNQLPAGRGGATGQMPAAFSRSAVIDLPCPRKTCSPQGQPFLPTFLGLEKVGRLAGRVPPVLVFNRNLVKLLNLNFAGPGRQPGYFLCRAQRK